MQKIVHLILLLLLMFSVKPVLAAVVIFEAGFGQQADTWEPLNKYLPPDYQVVTYTRPNLMRAEQTPTTIDDDVAYLLSRMAAFPNQKVFLVGHSYGGLIVTEAARLVPEQVAGVILLEPTVRWQRNVFKSADAQRIAEDDALMKRYLPASLNAQFHVLMQQLDAPDIARYTLPPALPVVIFTSTKRPSEPLFFEETHTGKQLWLALHLALIADSVNAVQIRSSKFGHEPHREQPEWVAQTIMSMISR